MHSESTQKALRKHSESTQMHSDALGCCNHARTFCLAKPGSTTYTIPSMVREVSAMFVEKTILRPGGPPGLRGGGGGSKMAR